MGHTTGIEDNTCIVFSFLDLTFTICSTVKKMKWMNLQNLNLYHSKDFYIYSSPPISSFLFLKYCKKLTSIVHCLYRLAIVNSTIDRYKEAAIISEEIFTDRQQSEQAWKKI